MAITVGSLTIKEFRAFPFAYRETNVQQGLVSRGWDLDCVLSRAQVLTLLSTFETWRTARKAEADALTSLTVGTTVSLTGTVMGTTWTAVPCWFTAAPTLSGSSGRLIASFGLVDANEALAALVAEQELGRIADEASQPTFGTVTLGTTTLTLLEPPDGRTDLPTLQLSASGVHYIQGPLGATATRRIVAYATAAQYTTLRTWFDTQVAATPSRGTWWSVAFPEPSADEVITGGAWVTRYRVTIEQVYIR